MNKIIVIISFLLTAVGFASANVEKKSKIAVPASAERKLTEDERARFDYYFFEAQRLKDIQQLDAQLDALRICLSIDSANTALQSELGTVYMRLRRYSEAAESFKKAASTTPDNWWYQVEYIRTLAGREQYESAIRQIEQLQKYFPQREEVYTMLASLCKQTGELDKAIAALNQLEVYAGKNEAISLEKFQIYLMLNKEKKAIEEIESLMLKYPQESRYKVMLGDIYLELKQAGKAFEIYQQVLRSDPNNPYVYVSLSNYYKDKGDEDKAMDAIMSALRKNELPVETKMEILDQYVDQLLTNSRKADETEALFKLLIEEYPFDEQPHAYYAQFLQTQKRQKEALEELESVVSINPRNEIAWKSALQILMAEEDTTGILGLTERALKVVPHVPEMYYYRSMAFYQQNKIDDAIAITKSAIENLTSVVSGVMLSTFYGQLGDIYHQRNEKELSYANYEKSLELNPANVYVLNNYAYYLSVENVDLRKAERMSAKAVEVEPNNSTYLDTYAWIFYMQGDFSLAKIYIEKAVENMKADEVSEVIYEHCGDIYSALGDKEKALSMWQKALELNTDNSVLKAKMDNQNGVNLIK